MAEKVKNTYGATVAGVSRAIALMTDIEYFRHKLCSALMLPRSIVFGEPIIIKTKTFYVPKMSAFDIQEAIERIAAGDRKCQTDEPIRGEPMRGPHWPHDCPRCGAAAYVGMHDVDCSDPTCGR